MPGADFYVDAAVIAAGAALAFAGFLAHDMTLFAIGCLIVGCGAYEMRQRFHSDVPHRP